MLSGRARGELEAAAVDEGVEVCCGCDCEDELAVVVCDWQGDGDGISREIEGY